MDAEGMVYHTLEQIAEVRVGLTRRRRPAGFDPGEEEGIHLLWICDLTASGAVAVDRPHKIPMDEVSKRFVLQTEDIVIANRGLRLTAALVPPGLTAVAGRQL